MPEPGILFDTVQQSIFRPVVCAQRCSQDAEWLGIGDVVDGLGGLRRLMRIRIVVEADLEVIELDFFELIRIHAVRDGVEGQQHGGHRKRKGDGEDDEEATHRISEYRAQAQPSERRHWLTRREVGHPPTEAATRVRGRCTSHRLGRIDLQDRAYADVDRRDAGEDRDQTAGEACRNIIMVKRVREVEEVDVHLEHEAAEGPRREVTEQRSDEAGDRALREVGLHQLTVGHAHRLQSTDQRPALVDHFPEHDVEHEDRDAHEDQRQQDAHGDELMQLAVHHVVARLVRPLREGLEAVALELRAQGRTDVLVTVAGLQSEAELVSHIAHTHQVLHVT